MNKIFCADCLEVMKDWPDKCVEVIITDPVWPGPNIWPEINALDLFQRAAPIMCRIARRIVIVLGCDIAPNMLSDITLPYIRTCWLRYARPHYKGRILYSSDVGYIYGELPAVRKGRFVLGGEYVKIGREEKYDHPCYRSLEHTHWLVERFSDEVVLDPFCGSGTTCVAAKMLGRRYIGIDINSDYVKIARERLRAVETGVPFNERKQGQAGLFDNPV